MADTPLSSKASATPGATAKVVFIDGSNNVRLSTKADLQTHVVGGVPTAAGTAVLTAADAAAQRTSLGLGTAATTAATDYATAAQGVTNGNSHDHSGGDGAQIAYSSLSGLPTLPTGTNTGDQTIANTSDATSHTVTLSGSGGSVQFVEGANITLTTTGTSGAGVVTIASTASGSGTVTSASVVSANGFAGTVADATTTPAITLTTSITGLLKGNGTAISAATAATDYAAAGAVGSTGITMSTARLLGRSTASTGAVEEITLGTNLSFSGTTLNATGGSGGGDVTAVGSPTSGQAAEWTSGTAIQGVAVTGTGSYVKATAPSVTNATTDRLTLSGNVSAAAWTTSGIGLRTVARTLTDTSSSGTVATAYTNVLGGNTVAASSATTFTNYFNTYINSPIAGTNVTLTNAWALGADSLRVNGASASSTLARLTATGGGTHDFSYTAGAAGTTTELFITNSAASVNTIGLRNTSASGFSAMTVRDHTGLERAAFGWGNSSTSAPFASAVYLEASYYNGASHSNAPPPLNFVQTGFLAGSYGNKLRQSFKTDGAIEFYAPNGTAIRMSIKANGDIASYGTDGTTERIVTKEDGSTYFGAATPTDLWAVLQIRANSSSYVSGAKTYSNLLRLEQLSTTASAVLAYCNQASTSVDGMFRIDIDNVSATADNLTLRNSGTGVGIGIEGSGGIAFLALSGSKDLFLTRGAAATLQLGAANAAATVAQTLRTQGPRGGTDTNTAGATWTLFTGPSTGTGTPATIRFQSTNVGSSGTTAQTLVDTFSIVNGCTRNRIVTVATLPAGPTTGDECRVSDALAPVWNTTLTGGGAVLCGARWNGSNWVAF